MAGRRPRHPRDSGRASARAIADPKRAEQTQLATYRISEAAHTAPTLEELFRAIHQIVGELMPAGNFYIALYDAAQNTISFPYFVDEYDPPPPPKPAGRGLTEYVLRTGEPLLADEGRHRELERRGEADLIGAPSAQWLGVPLKIQDTTIGVLAVQTYTEGVRYGEAETRVLEFVSTQIAMTVERKRADEMVRAQQRFLRQVIDANPSLIFVKDWDGKFTLVNQAVADIYGTTVEGLIGKGDADFNPNQDEVEHFLRDDREAMASGQPKFIAEEPVTDARTGGARWFQTVKIPLVGVDGSARQVVGVSTEITHRKQLEAQLLQAQKMEAIGRLAGGIAHDFNNLLTAMLGSTDLLLEMLGPQHPGREDAAAVRQAALRAADLTRQLLAFSRQQVLAPRLLDLNTLVLEVERMLERLIGEDVEVRHVLAPDLGVVRADPGQLEQVIMNLAVNARDAMPRGGRLTIETGNVDVSRGAAPAQVPIGPGPYVRLAVRDTGMGMDAGTKARVFEPFFTTKPKGKGTGLGLAMVYGIVKQSGGYIWVESEPDRGATFTIWLPRVEGTAEPATAPPPATALGGSETLLLVEDQAEVRRLTQKVLEARGYRVLVAADGEEALRVSQRHSGPIHLLVSDVVMPGMSGREVGLVLAPSRPEMRQLYISGYADESIVEQGVLAAGLAFLQKPFMPEALARKVREVLDAPASPPPQAPPSPAPPR